jgi:hypothetical protein
MYRSNIRRHSYWLMDDLSLVLLLLLAKQSLSHLSFSLFSFSACYVLQLTLNTLPLSVDAVLPLHLMLIYSREAVRGWRLRRWVGMGRGSF